MSRLTCSCMADWTNLSNFCKNRWNRATQHKYVKLTFNYFMEWILHMICFEFKIAEANWLTLLWLLRGECGESARDFKVIVLQHVNINYGLKTVTRISPFHFAYILPKYCDLLFLFVDCTGCRIQEIMITYVLVSRHETTFSLCGKRFVLGALAFRLHMYRSGKMACPRSMKCR